MTEAEVRKAFLKRGEEIDALEDEVERLRTLVARIAWHAMGDKPEHQAPLGNRMQNVYACCLRALGRKATKQAIETEPDEAEQIPGPKGGI